MSRKAISFVFGGAAALAVAFLPAPAGAATPIHADCDSGAGYVNVSGNCVHDPEQSNGAPSGATAECRDGDYSFSQHHTGTCSGHGGVAQWL